jgi:hypothetical protein
MKNKLIILISLLLGASMLLSSCGGAKVSDKGTTDVGASDVIGEGIPADATVKVWMSPSFTKIHQTQRAPAKLPKDISVQMACNEKESAQVTVRSTHSVSGLELVMTGDHRRDNTAACGGLVSLIFHFFLHFQHFLLHFLSLLDHIHVHTAATVAAAETAFCHKCHSLF